MAKRRGGGGGGWGVRKGGLKKERTKGWMRNPCGKSFRTGGKTKLHTRAFDTENPTEGEGKTGSSGSHRRKPQTGDSTEQDEGTADQDEDIPIRLSKLRPWLKRGTGKKIVPGTARRSGWEARVSLLAAETAWRKTLKKVMDIKKSPGGTGSTHTRPPSDSREKERDKRNR